MKRIFALLVIPALTLTGCAKYDNPGTQDTYQCQNIIRELHQAPHRYKVIGANKLTATQKAKLHKHYRHYDCGRYERSRKMD